MARSGDVERLPCKSPGSVPAPIVIASSGHGGRVDPVGRFLDCGLIEHGFARVRCGQCRAGFLVAFRCNGRRFCPSCHARRLAEWSLWLEERLLAEVAHRQVVLTLPKRLRAYLICDRRRLGLLSRIATRMLRAYAQAALGERGWRRAEGRTLGPAQLRRSMDARPPQPAPAVMFVQVTPRFVVLNTLPGNSIPSMSA